MSGLLAVLKVIGTLFAKGVKSSPVDAAKKAPESQEKTKPLFKNDSSRLQWELDNLYGNNIGLYELIFDVCDFCKKQFNLSVIITMIYRTPQEQDEIYKDDPKYKVNKFSSPHQFWQGVDIRSLIFDPKEIETLVNYINNKYNGTNFYTWSAKCHNIGKGEHFHIQFLKK